jgi:hypothetical protein
VKKLLKDKSQAGVKRRKECEKNEKSVSWYFFSRAAVWVPQRERQRRS